MLRLDIVTIFPKMVKAPLEEGIVGRAVQRGLLDVRLHDLRDHTSDRHRVVDDVPFRPAQSQKRGRVLGMVCACGGESCKLRGPASARRIFGRVEFAKRRRCVSSHARRAIGASRQSRR